MAAKFLDAAGLRYVITKIKALINDKQDKLTFDTTPTSGSSNPVTSDGIYQAVNNGITVSIEPSAGSETRGLRCRRKTCTSAEMSRQKITHYG